MFTKCQICKVEEDATEHVLQCQSESKRNKFNLQDRRYKNWEEIEIFKRNKKLRLTII